ncbi:MAG TPA: hypothetical protein VMP01_14915 [Pirellulaceae bacterium]|nr:hypothetical protein [Pirellulaceae bacterium]
MNQIPIRKVHSLIRKHQVRCLLMGGQACILYGGAEFSKDLDLAVLADANNLEMLRSALDELHAERIAVPPFESRYLEMGLAVHFRVGHPDFFGTRIDIMSKMRNVDSFDVLWERRTTVEYEGDVFEVLALPDLVKCKKTQRDKDWPMVAQLVAFNYFQNREAPSEAQIDFWFRELRTPSLLIELAAKFPPDCKRIALDRPLLNLAAASDPQSLRVELVEEENREREADRLYWEPLRREIERLRRERRS